MWFVKKHLEAMKFNGASKSEEDLVLALIFFLVTLDTQKDGFER